MNIGENLRRLRMKCGKSQHEVASLLGICRTAYSHYELNRRKPSYIVVEQLSEIFGVSFEEIIQENELSTFRPRQAIDINQMEKYKLKVLTLDGKRLTEVEVKLLIDFVRAERSEGHTKQGKKFTIQ